jgi:DNA-binding CsgD family transcriptional regulator
MSNFEIIETGRDKNPEINFYLPILQSIKAYLHLIDKEFRIRWTNSTGNKSNQYSGIIGKYCYRVYLKRNSPCRDCPVKRIFESHAPQTVEKWVSFPDGSHRCFEARIYPVFNKRRETAYAVKIEFDVTERKLAGEKHSQYVEALEMSLQDGIKVSSPTGPTSNSRRNRFRLSKREIQVLRLMSEGLSNMQISKDLSISHNTVKTHVTHILNKIGVNDRTQASVLAARIGII